MTSATTETHAGKTPILDREAPLPPRLAPGSGLTVVRIVWFGMAGLFATCLLLDRPPILRPGLLTDVRQWFLNQSNEIGGVGLLFD